MQTHTLPAIVALFAFAALPLARAADETSAGNSCCATFAEKTIKNPGDDYPLTTCVISGKPLGSMGEPVVYVHKQEGQPGQTVKFCCKMCIASFKKNPEAALAKIADARRASSHATP